MEHCHHDCKHESIKYCSKCNKVYCEKCGREWEDKCALNHYYPYTWYQSYNQPCTQPPYWTVTQYTTTLTGDDLRQKLPVLADFGGFNGYKTINR